MEIKMDNLDIKNLRRMLRESLVRETNKQLNSVLSEQSTEIKQGSTTSQGVVQGVRDVVKKSGSETTGQENKVLQSVFDILFKASAIPGVDLNSKKNIVIKNLVNMLRGFGMKDDQIQSVFGNPEQDKAGEPKTQNENMDFSTGEKIRDDGHEVSMAESELYKIAEYAPEIYAMIENYEDLPGWVQKKITIASENISSVKHYLEHEHFRNKSGLGKQ